LREKEKKHGYDGGGFVALANSRIQSRTSGFLESTGTRELQERLQPEFRVASIEANQLNRCRMSSGIQTRDISGTSRFASAWRKWALAVFVCASSAALAKPPPEPAFGVLRVWHAGEGQNVHLAGPGDVIFVEVKDFSGWIIRQVEIRGYFADKAIDSGSAELKRVVQNHAFEATTAAVDALENAIEGDRDVLGSILGERDLATYTKALLESENKWTEDAAEQRKLLRGRRAPERVIGPLLATRTLLIISDLLPQDAEKHVDQSKTIKLLEEVKSCSEQLIRAAKETLRPKINDIALEEIGPLNANSAVIDQYRRPKANPLTDYEWFRFRLSEEGKSAAAWNELRRSGLYAHDVGFTLTTVLGGRTVPLPTTILPPVLDGVAAHSPEADRLLLQIASPWWTYIAIAIYLLVLAILIVLASRTDLVRDTAGCRRPDGLRPFSLARAQMAFWFLVIIGASLFLWLATGTWHILNDTCLWLIGIGSGTALGSAIISETDVSSAKPDQRNPLGRKRRENLADFKISLDDEINKQTTALDAATTPEAKAPIQARLDALLAQKADLAQMPDRGWKRLMNDWLTDGDVYSFHRYQMLAWTLVLGLFFIAKVWSKWELPTFDGTTLALLGITSGTYLGFKLQKNK
jgi:hypothetical protein